MMLSYSNSTRSATLTTLPLLLTLVITCSFLILTYANHRAITVSTINTISTVTTWLAYNYPVVLLLASGGLLASTLVVVTARATVLTWITVLVLLAFAGKRRRVLVQQGRKITADVVMYMVKGPR